MYNFFSSNFKRRAFEKALAQIKKEGYYIELDDDSDAATILPDISSEIASLGNDKPKNKAWVEERTFDIIEAYKQEERKKPVANKEILTGEYTKQNKDVFYKNLFGQSNTFLNKTDAGEVELLSSKNDNTSEDGIKELTRRTDTQIFEQIKKRAEERQKQKGQEEQAERERRELLEAENKAKQAEEEKQKAAAEEARLRAEQAEKERRELLEAENRAKQAEAEKLEAQAQAEAERLRAEQAEAQAKLEREKAEQARLAALATAAAKPKPKPRTTPKTGKRKRKYDADIVGGFDF